MLNRTTLAALALLAPAAASAQSAGDFTEAAASPVRYTLATAHPQPAYASGPVRNFIDTVVDYFWNAQALDGVGFTLPKARIIAQAELDRCDAADGVKDGVIADTRLCDFRAARDAKQCASGTDGDDCLTPRQAEAVQRIEDGIRLRGDRLSMLPGIAHCRGGAATDRFDAAEDARCAGP